MTLTDKDKYSMQVKIRKKFIFTKLINYVDMAFDSKYTSFNDSVLVRNRKKLVFYYMKSLNAIN